LERRGGRSLKQEGRVIFCGHKHQGNLVLVRINKIKMVSHFV
jgi:hypothetical protein